MTNGADKAALPSVLRNERREKEDLGFKLDCERMAAIKPLRGSVGKRLEQPDPKACQESNLRDARSGFTDVGRCAPFPCMANILRFAKIHHFLRHIGSVVRNPLQAF